MSRGPLNPLYSFDGQLNAFALDGGGVKGIVEARMFERLTVHIPDLRERIGLIAGTSTGGILGLALAAGIPVEECVALYRDNAERIFQTRGLLDQLTPDEYFRANYDAENLKGVLEDVFGDKRLTELEIEVLIVCFDLARFRGKFLDNTDDWSLVDAGLATSAAPTYFRAHVVHEAKTASGSRVTQRGSTRVLVDGGVIANNPSERALTYAFSRLGARDIRLLSFGAGASPYRPPDPVLMGEPKELDMGFRQWIINKPHLLMKVLFDGSVGVAHRACDTILNPKDDAGRPLGPQRYHRVQPVLPEDVDLADYTKVPLLLNVADQVDLDPTVAWIEENWPAAEAA